MQNPSNVLYYEIQQGEDDHEIFHQEPLRPAPDGGAGALCAGHHRQPEEISERQNLSLKYLEQIVTPLARVGLVKSERGSQGGYRLTKDPADYTAGEILRAIEGSVAPIPCLGSVTNECPMSEQCFTLPFWAGLDEVINQYIDSVTLEQLASQLPAPDSAAQESCCSCGGTKNEK